VIEVESRNIQLFKTIKAEDDFVDLYYLKENVNINDVIVQQEEVEKIKLESIEEIKYMIQNNEFSESHTDFFIMCLNFLNKK